MVPLGIPEFDWWFWNEPQPNGHQVRLPRGRLVGGSSMVNSTIAVWPAPSDLDGWAAAGATGWDSASIAPYLRRVETDPIAPTTPGTDTMDPSASGATQGPSGRRSMRPSSRRLWSSA